MTFIKFTLLGTFFLISLITTSSFAALSQQRLEQCQEVLVSQSLLRKISGEFMHEIASGEPHEKLKVFFLFPQSAVEKSSHDRHSLAINENENLSLTARLKLIFNIQVLRLQNTKNEQTYLEVLGTKADLFDFIKDLHTRAEATGDSELIWAGFHKKTIPSEWNDSVHSYTRSLLMNGNNSQVIKGFFYEKDESNQDILIVNLSDLKDLDAAEQILKDSPYPYTFSILGYKPPTGAAPAKDPNTENNRNSDLEARKKRAERLQKQIDTITSGKQNPHRPKSPRQLTDEAAQKTKAAAKNLSLNSSLKKTVAPKMERYVLMFDRQESFDQSKTELQNLGVEVLDSFGGNRGGKITVLVQTTEAAFQKVSKLAGIELAEKEHQYTLPTSNTSTRTVGLMTGKKITYNIVVSPNNTTQMDQVALSLREMGVEIENVLKDIGIITVKFEPTKLKDVQSILGVETVEPNHEADVNTLID